MPYIHWRRVACTPIEDGVAVAICSQDVLPCDVGRIVCCRVVSRHGIAYRIVSRRDISAHVILR